ncbi:MULTISPECIES: undecaprenyl-diphosphatase [Bacillus cereus group]|uniref:undecaprenyl-diphosphatase n=1 Tax=Bacillus cereus group TaxID=86661 RepID=UPI0008FE98FF|nr:MULTISPECIES: undecaprenyl-diphosphatase [Bacillus cereus group]MCM0003924.1 undecaprenyl-diphosphatase [Bacillus paranthracis]MCU5214450.1 undecaprenyl-diphosphatase [Bacillus paranthracis]MCU5388326.1 undecaprenyl-diphosphatase [Bacillus paranthracis]MDA1954751.1 undecaprenyl-diphosphatase [Bacillus cereus group sp. BcHK114]OJE28551.1 undecaprenyl-diphosphatase [Bacillus paranthracis]
MSFSQFNIDIFRAINDLGKQYSFLNPAIVFLAEYMVYILALIILTYWFIGSRKSRMMVIQAMVAFVIAEVIGKIAGKFHLNYQPFAVLPDVNKLVDHAVDNSFPSDHTILFFSICFSFWLVRKKTGWLWLILALCVAISRIWVGVHYPFDVAVGALIGCISAVFSHWLVPKLSFIRQLLTQYERVEKHVLSSKNKSKGL